jgi:hypothetical protein
VIFYLNFLSWLLKIIVFKNIKDLNKTYAIIKKFIKNT